MLLRLAVGWGGIFKFLRRKIPRSVGGSRGFAAKRKKKEKKEQQSIFEKKCTNRLGVDKTGNFISIYEQAETVEPEFVKSSLLQRFLMSDILLNYSLAALILLTVLLAALILYRALNTL